LLKKNDTVIDIGAHIGVFSLLASKYVSQGKIYAFEPFGKNYDMLVKNVKINHLDKIIKYENVGIGKRGVRRLYINPHNSGAHSLFLRKSKYSKVKIIPLSNVFKKYQIQKCDLLKIDCEGAEKEILLELPKKYLKKINKIIIEYSNESDKWVFYRFLESNDFKVEFENFPYPIIFARRLIG